MRDHVVEFAGSNDPKFLQGLSSTVAVQILLVVVSTTKSLDPVSSWTSVVCGGVPILKNSVSILIPWHKSAAYFNSTT